MDRKRFEWLVAKALDALPEEFIARLENITVVVEDQPTRYQLGKARLKHSQTLLGLYEGVPLTERGSHYGLVVPDKITIFQVPIESEYRDDDEMAAEIQRVVQHEIAHHFGISDARLKQLGK